MESHIYHRLSKNKNKLPKLTYSEIYNYLQKLYPLADISFHESMYRGTYIYLVCHHNYQNIRIELNKYTLLNSNREKIENEKKIGSISKNSYLFYMSTVDSNIVKKFKLKKY